MSFSSTVFLVCFLPVSLITYWLLYKRPGIQNVVLLIEGLVFYMSTNWKYTLILVLCVLLTYFSGISAKKQLIVAGIIANFAGLAFFKYAGLFSSGILLPVGMSFYIFQATGYLMDVMKGKEEPEKDIISLAVFLCFFPTVTAGPILRYDQMKHQIRNSRKLSFYDFQRSVMIFSYGLFLKLALADRIGLLVDNIYGSYRDYSGQILFIGAVAYSIQIYSDFAGYSYMAAALAMFFGFTIPDNFRQPYYAASISDFWRRWHISLSSWLRDYVYINLGGNRKGKYRKYLNTLVTFFISGLWHGAGLNYVVWGLLHGLFIVAEDHTSLIRKTLQSTVGRVCRSIYVFFVVTFLWIFFRADSVITALSYIRRIFSEFRPWELSDGTLFSLGIDRGHMFVLFVFLIIVAVISYLRGSGYSCHDYCRQHRLIKGLGFVLLVLTIVCFGKYGLEYSASRFIYAGF